MKYVNCIFCGADTSTSNSIEHIIPESLGNIDLVLKKGMVCDICNNYFSREIESKIINSKDFISYRLYSGIPSKKGKIPLSNKNREAGITEIKQLLVTVEPTLLVGINQQAGKLISEKKLVLPSRKFNLESFEDKYTMSRFLGKIAIEEFVNRFSESIDRFIPDVEEEDNITFQISDELKPLINHVRKGNREKKEWSYYCKKRESIRSEKKEYVHLDFDFIENDAIFVMEAFNHVFKISLSKRDYFE